MATPNDIINAKLKALNSMQSTFQQDVLNQGSQGRPFQVNTAAPYPNYPAAGAAAVVLVTYQVPAGCLAVLTGLAIVNIGNGAPAYVDGDGNVVWRLLKNGAGVQGFEALSAQVGSLALPQNMGLVLVENDILQVTVQVPAGKITPGSVTAALLQGFINVGGQGARPGGSLGGAPSTTSTSSSTSSSSSSTSSGGATGGAGGYSGGSGGCFMLKPWPTRIKVLGNHRWEMRQAPQGDWIQLVANNRWRTNCTPGQRWLTPDRGLVAAQYLKPGDLIVTVHGEIPLMQVIPFTLPGVRAEVTDLDASQSNAGRLVIADGFIGHNLKPNNNF